MVTSLLIHAAKLLSWACQNAFLSFLEELVPSLQERWEWEPGDQVRAEFARGTLAVCLGH